jgi:hypothetical protein
MTPRRQRLSEDRPLRGLSERTQARDGRAVRPLADHAPKSPERLTEEARRDSCLSLKHGQHASRAASPIALGGLTFFSAPTRKRAWSTLRVVRASHAPTVPVILRPPAGHGLLQPVRLLRSQVCLPTLDAGG